MEFERKTLPEQHYLYVDREAGFTGTEIADAMGSGFGEVYGFIQKNGIAPLSMPVSMYMEMPNGPKMAFRCVMFVSADDAQKAADGIKAGSMPAGDAVTGLHVGPYASLNESHKALWAYCEGQGYARSMPVWEHYVDDPTTVEEAKCRTEIFTRLG